MNIKAADFNERVDVIKKIWRMMRPYRYTVFGLCFCCVLGAFINILYPYIFGVLVNEVFYHRNIEFFKIIVFIYCAIFAGEQMFLFFMYYLWSYLMTKFLFDIRKAVFESVMLQKAKLLSNIRSGDVITRINRDSIELMNLIHLNTFHVLARTLRLLFCFVFVAIISYKIAIVMVFATFFSVYASLKMADVVKPSFENYRQNYGKSISWVMEILGGMREIRLFAIERNVAKEFVKKFSDLIRMKVKINYIKFTGDSINSLIALVSDITLYAVCVLAIIDRDITLGGFIAIIEYFRISKIVFNFVNQQNIEAPNRIISANKVFEILNEPSELDVPGTLDIDIQKGRIEYIDVAFKYEETKVLNRISFAIEEGEKVAIVGLSGSGKSTLVSLLLRFYDPDEGKITIDGIDIKECTLKSLRRSIGMVQQDVLLFDGSIRHNLLLGNPKSSEQDIWEALQKVGIDKFIASLPDKLDTVVGTEGINLSGGQKQKLAIARIFLKNPKILICDEATSAIDNEAEEAIQSSWMELSKGKTSIVVAHRLSTILDCDKVAVLHDGSIVSYGRHIDLLNSCEYYRHLFQEQYCNQGESAAC